MTQRLTKNIDGSTDDVKENETWFRNDFLSGAWIIARANRKYRYIQGPSMATGQLGDSTGPPNGGSPK